MKTAASAKPELNHKPAGGKPRFSAKMTAFASTGIACPLAWGFLINAFGGVSPSAQLPWTFSYLLLAVAVLLFAAVSRKASRFFTSGISAAVVGAFGALGALLLALTFTAIPLDSAPICRHGPMRMRSWLAIPAVGNVLCEARFAPCGGLPAAG